MSELTGRVALVTGASRGIGRAVAIALARAGCDVAVNYHIHEHEAFAVVAEAEALGRRSIAVQADIADEQAVARMAETVEGSLGIVEVLVNNAGVATPKPIDALTTADFDSEIRNNLRSAFLVTQAFLPAMRGRRFGRIIFISSVAAQVGGVVGPHYAASKAGMHGLAHAYASQLAHEGVTANSVAPALIETDMIRNNPRARSELIPVGRFGRAEEVADTIVSLARNGYITGQTINVNGGWYFS